MKEQCQTGKLPGSDRHYLKVQDQVQLVRYAFHNRHKIGENWRDKFLGVSCSLYLESLSSDPHKIHATVCNQGEPLFWDRADHFRTTAGIVRQQGDELLLDTKNTEYAFRLSSEQAAADVADEIRSWAQQP